MISTLISATNDLTKIKMESPAENIHLSNYLRTNQIEDGGLAATQNHSGRHEFSLPQADGGKDAWLFLAAGFVVEALVWGKQCLFLDLVSILDMMSFREIRDKRQETW